MKRLSSTTTTLLTVATLSALVGIAAYELSVHPKLRRKVTAGTYDALAAALSPLRKATHAGRRTLGRRFGMVHDAMRDTDKKLSRKQHRLRDEAEAERMAAAMGV